MIFKDPEPKNLEEWLDMATKGIAAGGKERIAREIGAHYAEAVEAHVNQGESEEIARAKALGELGDAKVARRRFRKEHLTWLEDWRVVRLRNWASNSRMLGSILSGLWLMLVFSMRHPRHSELFFVPMCVGWIVVPVLLLCATSRLGYESKPFSLRTLLSLQSFQFATFCLWSALVCFSESAPIIGWVSVLGFIAIPILSFQTWKKIRKNENPEIEKPQGDTPRAA